MQEIKAYKAIDGEIFEFESSCVTHEKQLREKKYREYWLSELRRQDWIDDECDDEVSAYGWIIENTKGFKDLPND